MCLYVHVFIEIFFAKFRLLFIVFIIVLNLQVGIDFEFLHAPTYTNFLDEVMFMASLNMWKEATCSSRLPRTEITTQKLY